MVEDSQRSVEVLVGEQLSAVSFVQDYVELHFDGPVVRSLTNPIARNGQHQVQFPAPGSRDALCEFIGRSVASVELNESLALALHFEGGGSITVPLDDVSCRGQEAMHFQLSLTGPLQVW